MNAINNSLTNSAYVCPIIIREKKIEILVLKQENR